MLRKLLAVDTQYANFVSHRAGIDPFPIAEVRDLVIRGGRSADVLADEVDVIETLVTIQKRVPEDESAEAMATVAGRVDAMQYALEMKGCRTIICPAKRAQGGGFKQSDDQRLTIAALSACLKLRPDFLVFVAADGDYAPLLWELRSEGIRTEVIATMDSLARDLQRAAYTVVDLEQIFSVVRQNNLVENIR